jgi:hypothetical protein
MGVHGMLIWKRHGVNGILRWERQEVREMTV